MREETLAAAAQTGGVPIGWTQDALAELAVKHFLLATNALTQERRRWHLRQRTMLLDLLATKEQDDSLGRAE